MKIRMKIMQEVRNFKRRQPKSWQDKKVTRHIRACYTLNQEDNKNKRIKTALAIYLVLTELESNNELNVFNATYNTISKLAGVSYSTARRYCADFIKIKILHKENIKNGKVNYSNKWALLEYVPMTFISVQNNKHTLLGSKVNNKDGVSIQENNQPPAYNNDHPSAQDNSQE